ncbi:unnamed protein product [Musa textilis]
MTSIQSNSIDSLMTTKKDPAWKYNYLKDLKDLNVVTCMFYDKTTKGGIFRAKQYLVENFKNAVTCKKCPLEVKEELLAYMNEKKMQKNESYENLLEDNVEHIRDEKEDYSMSINSSKKKVYDKKRSYEY